MIAIVRPNSKQKIYGVLEDSNLTAVEPPIWAALLAACIRQSGQDVMLLDNEIENLSVSELALRLSTARPRSVIISVCGHNPSASTQSMRGAVDLVEALKLFGIPTILHGLHPSALPEQTMNSLGVTGIIVGEGFDIVSKRESLEGIVYTETLADLNQLPFPAWDLLPVEKYRAHNWHCFGNLQGRSPYGVLFTSLGCPYSCSFCVIHAMFNNSRGVRFKDPKKVVEEIFWWIDRVGVRNIRILDENFTLNKKHVSDICSALKAKARETQFNLEKELNIWAYASVSTVDDDMLNNLRSIGVKWLCYGFETGNNAIAYECEKTLSHGDWTDKIRRVAQMTQHAEIHINANWMFGFENDSYPTMQQTLHLAQSIYAEWSNFYCTMAYPGSKLYEEVRAKGWPLPATWEGYSQYSPESLPLPTNYLEPHEVIEYRDYAFNTYFTNPGYLRMIENAFGEETKKYIQEMTKTKLKRNV